MQSIPLLLVLYLIGFPRQKTFGPLWNHYANQKPRLIIITVFTCLMAWEFGLVAAIVLTIFTVILLEIVDRTKGSLQILSEWMKAASAALGPAVYLFAGFVLVFSYNDIIAAYTFTAAYDPVFQRMDAWIFVGTWISHMASSFVDRLSQGTFFGVDSVCVQKFQK